MTKSTLTAAFWDYDRTRRMIDGRVGLTDYDLQVEVSTPEHTFARSAAAEFDVSELSLSNSVSRMSRKALPYTLIPVFLSRAFRHSMIYVRHDRSIAIPSDLRGKRVGIQEYDMTAAVVVRGFLRDQFGVLPEDIRWLVGEENGGAMPDFAGMPPAGVSIEILPPGMSLEDRMIDGQLDAIVVLRPSARLNAAASISGRLFESFSQVERQWYEKSRHFPIMHVVGVRSSLVERDPDLPLKLYDAFLEAKRLAIEELEILQSPKVTVPWPHEAVADAKALMGTDYWPYGIRRNRHTLEAQLGWSWLDGLQARRITIDELFHKSLAES